MTQEDKQLLLKDLCARLPYSPYVQLNPGAYNKPEKCWICGVSGEDIYLNVDSDPFSLHDFNILPYLRPMSSMTYEEMQDAREKFFDGSDHYDIDDIGEIYADTYQPYTTVYTLSFARLSGYIDWLNSNHFDYRGLIEKGLALEAPEEMYKTK